MASIVSSRLQSWGRPGLTQASRRASDSGRDEVLDADPTGSAGVAEEPHVADRAHQHEHAHVVRSADPPGSGRSWCIGTIAERRSDEDFIVVERDFDPTAVRGRSKVFSST